MQATGDEENTDLAYRRELAAWGEFERWRAATDFTGLTDEQITAAMLAKLDELGL